MLSDPQVQLINRTQAEARRIGNPYGRKQKITAVMIRSAIVQIKLRTNRAMDVGLTAKPMFELLVQDPTILHLRAHYKLRVADARRCYLLAKGFVDSGRDV